MCTLRSKTSGGSIVSTLMVSRYTAPTTPHTIAPPAVLCPLIVVFTLAVAGGRAQAPPQVQPSAQEGLDRMGIVGYADHLTAQPGDSIKFMVSSNSPRYRADIVRIIHGDANPK